MRRRANREETTPRTNTRMLPMNRRQFITMKLEATPSPRLGRQLTPWFKGQVLTSSPLYFYSSIRVKIRFHIRELSSSIDFFFMPKRFAQRFRSRTNLSIFVFDREIVYRDSFHLIRLHVFFSSLAAFRSRSRERYVPFRFLLLYLIPTPIPTPIPRSSSS